MKLMSGLLIWAVLAIIASAAELLPIEKHVSEVIKSPGITVVHFWAPWCSNCGDELAKNGWSTFIDTNAEVKFIFITSWHNEIGRELLTKNGVGAQANFELLLHPNGARSGDGRMTQFLGLPVTWLPATWIFSEGQLRYAMNYGELRFPILQQLIRDTADKW
jgi:thiol-disulfide isomerase/thioredoxin